MSVFSLPDLGEGLVEAEIVQWLVGPGDHVVAGQPLVSVETDKSVVEVPAPRSGTVTACHGEPGDLVAVGAPLVTFAEEGDGATDAGTVVGSLPAGPVPVGVGGGAPDAHRASPAVRALAKRLGVDLASIEGSGPGGVVTSADVEEVAGVATGAVLEPLRGVRRAMAANMERAGREVVAATVHELADVGEWGPAEEPTLRLLRAVAVAAAAEPALNAEYLGPDHGRRLHREVNVGIAVDTADGLFVPVLHDVAHRDADSLRDGLARLRADVEARSIPPEEMAGATVALSNYGMHGGLHAELVVLPPLVAIVGAGRVHDAVVAVAGQSAVRSMMPLSLTFDHRVVTGVEATRFLAALARDLHLPT